MLVNLYNCIDKFINLYKLFLITMVRMKNWTTMYIRIETKEELERLKLYSESYDAAIRRLMNKRTYDVVNGEVIELEVSKIVKVSNIPVEEV